MSKCTQCGYSRPPNPIACLLFGVNNWMMTVFLDHMTPLDGALWGAENFWINWHWFFWWCAAIGAGIGGVMFLLTAGAWLSDPDGYYQPRRS